MLTLRCIIDCFECFFFRLICITEGMECKGLRDSCVGTDFLSVCERDGCYWDKGRLQSALMGIICDIAVLCIMKRSHSGRMLHFV